VSTTNTTEEKEVTEEFEVSGLRKDMHHRYVVAEILHKPCENWEYVPLSAGEWFECEECKRKFKIESIFPFKIMEVKRQ
jgi:hypothetical protein